MLVGQDLDQFVEFGVGIGGNLHDMEHVGVKGGDWVVGVGDIGVVGVGDRGVVGGGAAVF